MAAQQEVSFRLKRPDSPLPNEELFLFGPDQREAWRNFGNLSLTEAYRRFIETPWTYQEDFMWMGTGAFAYYFPVIDKYLREVRRESDFDDGCCAWILGCGVLVQFHWADGHKPPPQVVDEIAELSAFVRSNLNRYSTDPQEQAKIDEKWREVDEEVAITRGDIQGEPPAFPGESL